MISPERDEIAFHAKCTTHSQKNDEEDCKTINGNYSGAHNNTELTV